MNFSPLGLTKPWGQFPRPLFFLDRFQKRGDLNGSPLGHGNTGKRESLCGFSLIELLVAITITGLMASFMYVDLRFSVGAWVAGEKKLDQVGQISSIQYFLRGRLEEAYPQWRLDEKGEGRVAFHGESHLVSFVAPMQTYLGKAPFYDLSIGVKEEKQDRKDMELIWKPIFYTKKDEEVEPEKFILLENIEDIEFRYFGSEDADTEPVWLEEWVNKKQLPFLISVTVHFPDGDERVWPELTVAHRIQMDSACKFDNNVSTCADRTILKK
ncbi:MAG: prepilin-type N-terminal cleavage/methylation domain-containing protein [Magnetococcales bacterium]|nr:prepilin-type N-terminal cleavage/methylation domain-containing protein [Magnetococcales bacterium]